jgi:ferredoxin-type protein NapF
MSITPTISRRNFLQGGKTTRQEAIIVRPPWSDERKVSTHCTSCGDCISACPQSILFADRHGRPIVTFERGECTFCGSCAEVCKVPVFDPGLDDPWQLTVSITSQCLLHRGVTCQLCTDACDKKALRLDMRPRPSGMIIVDTKACTGCGACISSCPEFAIIASDQRSDQPG